MISAAKEKTEKPFQVNMSEKELQLYHQFKQLRDNKSEQMLDSSEDEEAERKSLIEQI